MSLATSTSLSGSIASRIDLGLVWVETKKYENGTIVIVRLTAIGKLAKIDNFMFYCHVMLNQLKINLNGWRYISSYESLVAKY